MHKPITIRVRFVPTTRTDLICVACGGFNTDLAVEAATGREHQAGVHKRCVDRVRRGVGTAVAS